MDEDYDRIEREIAQQNERIATAESVLERLAAAPTSCKTWAGK